VYLYIYIRFSGPQIYVILFNNDHIYTHTHAQYIYISDLIRVFFWQREIVQPNDDGQRTYILYIRTMRKSFVAYLLYIHPRVHTLPKSVIIYVYFQRTILIYYTIPEIPDQRLRYTWTISILLKFPRHNKIYGTIARARIYMLTKYTDVKIDITRQTLI